MRWIAAIIALLPISPAHAAVFDLITIHNMPALQLSGPIVEGDYGRFMEAIGNRPYLIISLDSHGGIIDPALSIGRIIRERSYDTLVSANAICESACAIIWVSGAKRFAHPTGAIGFHAAFHTSDHETSSEGNALLGAYYGALGFNAKAIVYMTAASPGGMRYLSYADAVAYGLDYTIDAAAPPPQVYATVPVDVSATPRIAPTTPACAMYNPERAFMFGDARCVATLQPQTTRPGGQSDFDRLMDRNNTPAKREVVSQQEATTTSCEGLAQRLGYQGGLLRSYIATCKGRRR